MGASCWAPASPPKAETSELTWVTWFGKQSKWLSPRGTPVLHNFQLLLVYCLQHCLASWKQRNKSLFWPFARQLCVHLSLSSRVKYSLCPLETRLQQISTESGPSATSPSSSSLAHKKYLPGVSLLMTPASLPSLVIPGSNCLSGLSFSSR